MSVNINNNIMYFKVRHFAFKANHQINEFTSFSDLLSTKYEIDKSRGVTVFF